MDLGRGFAMNSPWSDRRLSCLGALLLAAAALSMLPSCSGEAEQRAPLTREQLLDPESCKDCHPKHYEEWSSSMHAYASRDPVFIAMNRRGQEEAKLDEFCVNCHAPMAVHEKAITDFADLSDVPAHLQGVTCYFCHNAISVAEPHANGNIQLANDTTMRGALNKPLKPWAHDVSTIKSSLHDPNTLDSSLLCGTCHDIINPMGVHIERTLEEYLGSVHAKPGEGFNSCQDCHMRPSKFAELAAVGVDGVVARDVHSHLWPGVDTALTPDLPHQQAMRAAVESCELQVFTLSGFEIQLADSWVPGEPYTFSVVIEQSSGHNFPSGASADRRLWVEVTAYDAADQVLVESGKIADGELEEKPEGDPAYDPQFRPFRDYWTDLQGNETHMFWEVAAVESRVLPAAAPPTATQPDVPPHVGVVGFTTDGPVFSPPARIEVRLRLRPMGVDVLQDLVDSKHLDASIIQAMPTYTLTHQEGTYLEAQQRYRMRELTTPDCQSYVCMLHPESQECLQ
jgi:nitrate/TMAO reductase-like tetraheme cytochrome c subunit